MSTATRTENVLLLGRPGNADTAKRSIDMPGVRVFYASNVEEARAAVAQGPIDHVVIGSLENETKLQVVKAILNNSPNTTVHLNSEGNGAEGFPAFVSRLLRALEDR
jgi:ActR/RegA family two-component response regulator